MRETRHSDGGLRVAVFIRKKFRLWTNWKGKPVAQMQDRLYWNFSWEYFWRDATVADLGELKDLIRCE